MCALSMWRWELVLPLCFMSSKALQNYDFDPNNTQYTFCAICLSVKFSRSF